MNVGSHKIRIARGPELSAPAFDRHFSQLASQYGSVVIINLLGSNLVGSKEGEATLSTAYQSQQSRSQHREIPHVLWDFHAEGGAKNLDRLESKVCNKVDSLSFFCSPGVAGSAQLQRGVVRTNCTDCLDRTNAVQMWLGRTPDADQSLFIISSVGLKTMAKQLVSLELDQKESIVSRFEESFKQMWVSNGNALSKIYAGTAALSQGGSKLLDGARSAARTIQNNLLDKDKQEAFDLLVHGTGRFTDFADRARLLLPVEYWTGERSSA